MPKFNFRVVDDLLFKRIHGLWNMLIGNQSDFSLECRIFHSISVCLIFLAAFYIPYNILAGLYVASLSCFILGAIFTHQFYYSRFRGKAHSNIIFGLTGIIIFSINYFSNAGINGSTDLIWPAYLLFVFAISPYRQHLMWLIIYLLSFVLLHVTEFYYPSLVRHPFNTGRGQFIDRITAFPIPVVAIYIIIKFIRRKYDKERNSVEEKAIAIALRNEQILLQKNQLEQSNAEKNKLMSIISHDLRAPLINIQNYLELLNQDEIDSLQRPELEKSLLTATGNTMDMLSNLLYWSKSQMEGPVIHLSEINLLDELQATFEMERILAATKNISVNWEIPLAITVIADADMLQLVLRNLINNAIKFTPQGGHIGIAAQLIGEECKITVSDSGTGIQPDAREKLFSLNSTPAFGTNNERGAGLGLMLCKEFTERQSGRIDFESTVGGGSSFFIYLPSGVAVLNLEGS